MNYIFLQSVADEETSSLIRFRPLPGQKLTNDLNIYPTMNVRIPKKYTFYRDRGAGHFYAINQDSLMVHPGGTKKIEDYIAGDLEGAYLQVKDTNLCFPVIDLTEEEMGYTDPNTGDLLYHDDMFPGEDVFEQWEQYKNSHNMESIGAESVKKPKQAVSLKDKIEGNERFVKARDELLKEGFYVSEEDWTILVMNIICHDNTLLTGPAGSGKTELVRRACEKMNVPCYVFDMGSMYDPVSELLGTPRPDSGGKFVFDYSRFSQVIQKPGVVLLDELSRAQPSVNNILLPCLDSRRKLNVENAYSNGLREIDVHPECVFFATANVGDQYTGTKELDRALVDRFDIMEMSYLSEDKEIEVLKKVWKISNSEARTIVTVAQTIRSMKARGEIETSISTRETLRAAKLVSRGFALKDALPKAILPLFPAENNNDERERIRMTMQRF